MKLIHISDIHINANSIMDSDPIENFQSCMDHAAEHHGDADMVIISGDLTHFGQEAAYLQLKHMLATWAHTPHLIIGNHDQRETFRTLFPDVEKDSNGYVQYVRDSDAGRFIFLDTVENGMHSGHFDVDRQTWLKDQLDTATKEQLPAFIVMHHHPVDVGIFDSDKIGLVDGEAFRSILKEYKHIIRHIFFGHCHYILSGNVCGISMSAPRSTCHPSVPDFTGLPRTGVPPFPPTYDVCLISDDAVIVHSIDFMDEDKIIWHEQSGIKHYTS